MNKWYAGNLFSLPTPPKIYRDLSEGQLVLLDDIGIMAFNVEKGLNYFESLGVGGMNTRGMGRLRVLNLSKVSPVTTEVNAGGAK